jgi:glycosyltransferase involved in cell wall biosynthesis
MRIWLVTIGEPLPTDTTGFRLMKTGMLARRLVERGHQVDWWTSGFDHYMKSHRVRADTTIVMGSGLRLQLIRALGYGRNVSARRIVDHFAMGRRFGRLAVREAVPDLIYCSFPTLELSQAAVRFGEGRGIPAIIDVRDLWPDAFEEYLPRLVRPIGRAFLRHLSAATRATLARASGITAISDGYLDWALRNAERPRRDADGVFPLGYQVPDVSSSELVEAGSSLRAMGVDSGKLICWFVGTFGRTYDVETVVDSARLLANKGETRVQFVLSGTGEAHGACKRRAVGLPNVVFTGHVGPSQIRYMMHVATIGLAAYRKGAPQGLPNKPIEYLSAGLVLVSSLGPEAQELIAREEIGFSYEPGNAAALAAVIEECLHSSPRLQALRQSALRLFRARYDADVVMDSLAQHLERAATLTGGRRQLR